MVALGMRATTSRLFTTRKLSPTKLSYSSAKALNTKQMAVAERR